MAFMTVRFVPRFLECSLVELFQTETADKVFWMKLSEHGCDTPTLKQEIIMVLDHHQSYSHLYWFVTASAETASESVVVVLTVGEAIVFIECSIMKWFLTLFAHETIRMPLEEVFIQENYLTYNRLGLRLASLASLSGGHSEWNHQDRRYGIQK